MYCCLRRKVLYTGSALTCQLSHIIFLLALVYALSKCVSYVFCKHVCFVVVVVLQEKPVTGAYLYTCIYVTCIASFFGTIMFQRSDDLLTKSVFLSSTGQRGNELVVCWEIALSGLLSLSGCKYV